jgi:hypothetical protein
MDNYFGVAGVKANEDHTKSLILLAGVALISGAYCAAAQAWGACAVTVTIFAVNFVAWMMMCDRKDRGKALVLLIVADLITAAMAIVITWSGLFVPDGASVTGPLAKTLIGATTANVPSITIRIAIAVFAILYLLVEYRLVKQVIFFMIIDAATDKV